MSRLRFSRNASPERLIIDEAQMKLLRGIATKKFGHDSADDLIQTTLMFAQQAIVKGTYTGNPLHYWKRAQREFCKRSIEAHPIDHNLIAMRNRVMQEAKFLGEDVGTVLESIDPNISLQQLGLNARGENITNPHELMESLTAGAQASTFAGELMMSLGEIGTSLVTRAIQDPVAAARLRHWALTSVDDEAYISHQARRYSFSEPDVIRIAGVWLYPERARMFFAQGIDVLKKECVHPPSLEALRALREEPDPDLQDLASNLLSA